MAIIGRFTKSHGDELAGFITTLSIQVNNLRLIPNRRDPSEKSPSHRLFLDEIEVGAAWRNPANGDKRPSYSVKLDDPAFTAPVHAVLVEQDDGDFDLIWTRPSKRRGD
jgi:uncharacterized protein (DUF736 family)